MVQIYLDQYIYGHSNNRVSDDEDRHVNISQNTDRVMFACHPIDVTPIDVS
jgi:hypothetical protein